MGGQKQTIHISLVIRRSHSADFLLLWNIVPCFACSQDSVSQHEELPWWNIVNSSRTKMIPLYCSPHLQTHRTREDGRETINNNNKTTSNYQSLPDFVQTCHGMVKVSYSKLFLYVYRNDGDIHWVLSLKGSRGVTYLFDGILGRNMLYCCYLYVQSFSFKTKLLINSQTLLASKLDPDYCCCDSAGGAVEKLFCLSFESVHHHELHIISIRNILVVPHILNVEHHTPDRYKKRSLC